MIFHHVPSLSIILWHVFPSSSFPPQKKYGLCSDVQVKNSVPGRTWRVWVDGGKPEEAHSGGR
jgi:hypothetical protein